MWAFLRMKTLTACNGPIWQTLLYNKIYKSYQPYSAIPAKNIKPVDDIICQCSGTTRAHIQRLFEQGCNLDDISRRTGVISGCGGCELDIAQLKSLREPGGEGKRFCTKWMTSSVI